MGDSCNSNLGKLTRRLFMNRTAKALAGIGSFQLLPKETKAQTVEANRSSVYSRGFSIVQGMTSNHTTQLAIDVPREMKVQYRLTEIHTGREIPYFNSLSQSRTHSSWRVDQVHYQGLSCPGDYLFQVIDEKMSVLDERTLSTLDLNRRDVRIGVTSCMLDYSSMKKRIWNSVNATSPDILFLIGDVTYGDILGMAYGPELLWRRHIESRSRIPFYHQRNLIPTIVMWDDHDFGKNNADGSYKHKADSLNSLKAFFPQNDVEGVFRNGPGAAGHFSAFGHNFMFMDNRYFLDTVENGVKTYWGQDQRKWAFDSLNGSNLPVWFLQGAQFFGGTDTSGQSFESEHSEELRTVLNSIKNLSVRALFFSGDVHFTELLKLEKDLLGYNTYEITSSSLHSIIGPATPNERRDEVGLGHQFVFVDLGTDTENGLYRVTSVNGSKKIKFSREIVVG